MHRKFHCGRWHKGHWVLGLVEGGTGNPVLIPAADRSAQTLLPIIAPIYYLTRALLQTVVEHRSN